METNWSKTFPLSIDSSNEKGWVIPVSLPTSVADLTSALSPGQQEDVKSNVPSQDVMRHGEVDLEFPRHLRDTNMDQPVSSALPVKSADPSDIPSFASPVNQVPSSSAQTKTARRAASTSNQREAALGYHHTLSWRWSDDFVCGDLKESPPLMVL